ncbi:MAG TPA: hypothetical protein VN823_29225 [Stellaceae bacterium]|nr:hypothetical protein [Stellaceae bacterium]
MGRVIEPLLAEQQQRPVLEGGADLRIADGRRNLAKIDTVDLDPEIGMKRRYPHW